MTIINKDLKPIQVSNLLLLMIAGLLLSATFFLGLMCGTTTTKKITNVTRTDYVNLDTLSFTEDNLRLVLAHYDVWFPEVAYKQSKIETANWTSKIFKENNNGFGHRVHPRRWKGVEMPFTNRGHLVFSHWTKSVEHYKLWQVANYDREQYISFIGRIGYAEDENYLSKIR